MLHDKVGLRDTSTSLRTEYKITEMNNTKQGDKNEIFTIKILVYENSSKTL